MSWRRLGGVSGSRGLSWGCLGDVLGCLGPDLEAFLRVWLRLGRSLIALLVAFCYFIENVYFAYVFQCFLMSWACLGSVLEASWRRLGVFGARLGGVLGTSWAVLGCLGPDLEASLRRLGSSRPIFDRFVS